MIWGKLKKEYYSRMEKKDKTNWFAWRPMKLRDGRWIWMERVYAYWESWRAGGKTYFELPVSDVRYSTKTNTNVL
jgi:hypothetical protein